MNGKINVACTGTLNRCELRTSKKGRDFLRASVKCGEQWVTVLYFGDDAGVIVDQFEDYFGQVGFKGTAKLNVWEGRDGKFRAALDVFADTIQPVAGEAVSANSCRSTPESRRPHTPGDERRRRENAPSAAAEAIGKVRN